MPSGKSPNLDAAIVPFFITEADTETTIAHDLGRIPVEAFVLLRSSSASVYRGTTTWTSSNIFIRASAAIGGRLLVT